MTAERSSTDVLLVEHPLPGVAVLTMNRPDVLNALNDDLLLALVRALDGFEQGTRDVRVIVLQGAGRAFCPGADLKWLASGVLADDAAHGRFQDNLSALCLRLEAASQVVIGAVHGYALAGGLEVLLACDVVVAAKDAQLGDEHIRRDLVPGGGNSQRVPRKLGLARGMHLLLTGARFSGQQAHDWGLACAAVEATELREAALRLAADVATHDGEALATMKMLVRRGMELPLIDALSLERYEQHRYRSRSSAMDEGVAAFATAHAGDT